MNISVTNSVSPNVNLYSTGQKIDTLQYNICRICLSPDPTISLTVDHSFDSLAFRLFSCTSVKVCDDSLSQLLCQNCSDRLNDAYNLRKQAQHSNNVLRQRIGLIKIEYEEKCDFEIKLNSVLPNSPGSSEFNFEIRTNNQNITPKYEEKIEVSSSRSLQRGKVKKARVILSTNKISKIKKTVQSKTKLNSTNDSLSSLRDSFVKVIIDNTLQKNDKKCFPLNSCHSSISDNGTDKASSKISKTSVQKEKAFTEKDKKKYDCTLCSKVYNHIHSFARHMKVEHKLEGYDRPKRYICDICGNKFHDQSGLRIHKRSHSGVKPFSCKICGQEFSQQCNMERHVSAKHHKDKFFQCELCPRRYAYSSTLKEHVRNHLGNRDHVCETCGQRFSRRFALTRHQLTHTHARPYGCLHCPKSYTQTNDLKTHVKKTHIGVPTNKISDYIRQPLKSLSTKLSIQ